MGIHLPSVIGKGHQAQRVTLAVSTVTSLWLTGVFLVPYWGDSGLTIGSTVDPGRHLAVLLALLALIMVPGPWAGRILQMDDGMRANFRAIVCRIASSPFSCGPVSFIDVLIADCACSLAKNFADVYIGACVVWGSGLYGVDVMNTDARAQECILHWGTPAAIAIPTVWRMCQCYSRYQTSKAEDRWEHATNFAKYTTTLPVIFFAFLKRGIPEHHAWIIPSHMVTPTPTAL